jgi:hypothetical protein
MRTTQAIGDFAVELLNKMNEPGNNYFASLETLPELLPYSNFAAIDIDKHPLVFIESQMTLFKLKNVLANLALLDALFTEDNVHLLQTLQNEVLTKRYYRLHEFDDAPDATSDAYFYGATLPFKANEACIAIAKKFDTYFLTIDSQKNFAHYLIPDLVDKIHNKSTFSLEGRVIAPMGVNPKDGVTLLQRNEPLPTKLSVEDGKALYNVVFGGMINIEDLIDRLYALVPQNTWDLYLSCYNTMDMLTLAMDKPEIEPDAKYYSDEQFKPIKERIKTFLGNTTKYQDDLRLLDTSNQQRVLFEGYDVTLLSMQAQPSIAIPQNIDPPALIQLENAYFIYGLSADEHKKLTLLDANNVSLKALDFTKKKVHLSPIKNAALYDEIARKNGHTPPSFKPDLERWMKAAYFVLISLSSRIRSLLPDFLGRGGSWTGYPKQKRLEEAQVLLTFLTGDLPLKELPNWLDANHKEVKARLVSSTSSGRYGKFYADILQNTDKYLNSGEIKIALDPPQKKSGWFGMPWGQ